LEKGRTPPFAKESVIVQLGENDLLADTGIGEFRMCVTSVQSERHIEINQGRRNFAIVAVDKEIGKSPAIVAAENYDLHLPERPTAPEVVLKVFAKTDLKSWMQQADCKSLRITDLRQICRQSGCLRRAVIVFEP